MIDLTHILSVATSYIAGVIFLGLMITSERYYEILINALLVVVSVATAIRLMVF